MNNVYMNDKPQFRDFIGLIFFYIGLAVILFGMKLITNKKIQNEILGGLAKGFTK